MAYFREDIQELCSSGRVPYLLSLCFYPNDSPGHAGESCERVFASDGLARLAKFFTTISLAAQGFRVEDIDNVSMPLSLWFMSIAKDPNPSTTNMLPFRMLFQKYREYMSGLSNNEVGDIVSDQSFKWFLAKNRVINSKKGFLSYALEESLPTSWHISMERYFSVWDGSVQPVRRGKRKVVPELSVYVAIDLDCFSKTAKKTSFRDKRDELMRFFINSPTAHVRIPYKRKHELPRISINPLLVQNDDNYQNDIDRRIHNIVEYPSTRLLRMKPEAISAVSESIERLKGGFEGKIGERGWEYVRKNIVRLAALIHLYAEIKGRMISAQTISDASLFVELFLVSSISLINSTPTVMEVADELDSVMTKMYVKSGFQNTKFSDSNLRSNMGKFRNRVDIQLVRQALKYLQYEKGVVTLLQTNFSKPGKVAGRLLDANKKYDVRFYPIRSRRFEEYNNRESLKRMSVYSRI